MLLIYRARTPIATADPWRAIGDCGIVRRIPPANGREFMPTTLTPKKPAKRSVAALNGRFVYEPECVVIPATAHTLQGFREWTYSDDFPDTGKITYMGGEIFIDMSPERIDSHSAVKVEVSTKITVLVRRKKSGRVYFDGTRFANKRAKLSNEPDAFFVKFETIKSGGLQRVRTKRGDDYIEFEGTPDWILEIISPSSVTKDKKKLRKRYHKAGVGEYWLIDARGNEIDFQILIHGETDYEAAAKDGEWQMSKVFGKKFRLRRVEDELGDVDYRLDVK
jgi:Uma2 family endonuclease